MNDYVDSLAEITDIRKESGSVHLITGGDVIVWICNREDTSEIVHRLRTNY